MTSQYKVGVDRGIGESKSVVVILRGDTVIYDGDIDDALALADAIYLAAGRGVWEPLIETGVIPTAHPDGDGADTCLTWEHAPDLWGSKQAIQIAVTDINDGKRYYSSIVLPDDIRLCRLTLADREPKE